MEDLVVNRQLSIPMREIEMRTSRSSGPGGQHANVTASRVEAVFDIASSEALNSRQRQVLLLRCGPRVSAIAQDARSQIRNRELALVRLRSKLRAALFIPKRRRPTRPSRAAKERRLEQKRRTGKRKRSRRPPAEDT